MANEAETGLVPALVTLDDAQPAILIRRHDERFVDVVLDLPGAKANLCLEVNEAVELVQKLTALLAKAN